MREFEFYCRCMRRHDTTVAVVGRSWSRWAGAVHVLSSKPQILGPQYERTRLGETRLGETDVEIFFFAIFNGVPGAALGIIISSSSRKNRVKGSRTCAGDLRCCCGGYGIAGIGIGGSLKW